MAFFRLVPNLNILAPKDFKELENMLEFAVNLGKPVVIRYPRGGEDEYKMEKQDKIELRKSRNFKTRGRLKLNSYWKNGSKSYENSRWYRKRKWHNSRSNKC